MSIRRFENNPQLPSDWWIELDENTGSYRSNFLSAGIWQLSCTTGEELLSLGWKEVSLGLPPDAFSSKSGFDPNDLFAKPCCGGGVGSSSSSYKGGQWHDSDCDTLKPPQIPSSTKDVNPYTWLPAMPNKKIGQCTCGSSAVGSDRHSDYCDVK